MLRAFLCRIYQPMVRVCFGFFFGVRRASPLWVFLWVSGCCGWPDSDGARKNPKKNPKRRCSPHSKENPKADNSYRIAIRDEVVLDWSSSCRLAAPLLASRHPLGRLWRRQYAQFIILVAVTAMTKHKPGGQQCPDNTTPTGSVCRRHMAFFHGATQSAPLGPR